MPYPNEHAARIVDPSAFQDDSLRLKSIADGIRIIFGKQKGNTTSTTQAYRFEKDKFTEEQAKAWLKEHDIKYISFEAAINNAVDLHSVGNALSGTHDAVLQRLDTLIKNNGRMILYSEDAFRDAQSWIGAPVIYAETDGKSLKHPTGRDVTAGSLPLEYSVVGRVTSADIGKGEPVLRGGIEIDDPAIDAMVTAGEMSLSTGFSAQIANIDGQDKIVGSVAPNHVLIFKRGACPNCYPNDNSARFENIMEDEIMDDESKGMLKKIVEYFENLKPAPSAQEEITKMTDNTEELKNLAAERDALKAKVVAMENAAAQTKKDAAWAEIKNVLPAGWLGEKEAESRAAFENNAAAFAVKLAKFATANAGKTVKAEGSEIATTPLDAENVAKAEVEKFEKEYGLRFF